MRELDMEELEKLEDAMIKSLENFGKPEDVFIPEYGWILRNGKPTEEGLKWYRDCMEDL